MPSSRRGGAYVTEATAIVAGIGRSASTSAMRRPPRVTRTRTQPSTPPAAASSVATSARTAATSRGRRNPSAERTMRARCSSSANGRPAYTRMTSKTPSPRSSPSSVTGIAASDASSTTPSMQTRGTPRA